MRQSNNRNLQSTDQLRCHQNATSWAHAPPQTYQTANQNCERNGYFQSPECTHNLFGQREKQNKFHRFARADIPENCTIVAIRSGWVRDQDGTQKWEYTLKATTINPLSVDQHVGEQANAASERAIRETYQHRAEIQYRPKFQREDQSWCYARNRIRTTIFR